MIVLIKKSNIGPLKIVKNYIIYYGLNIILYV